MVMIQWTLDRWTENKHLAYGKARPTITLYCEPINNNASIPIHFAHSPVPGQKGTNLKTEAPLTHQHWSDMGKHTQLANHSGNCFSISCWDTNETMMMGMEGEESGVVDVVNERCLPSTQ